MAADWLKIEKTTPRKPEVLCIAQSLNIHPDQAFGICFRFWSWCDDNLETGNARGVTSVTLDALLNCDGFASALIEVSWLLVRNGSLEVPNYDRHLSENAKKRALSQERTKKSRSGRNVSVTPRALQKRDQSESESESENNTHTHSQQKEIIPKELVRIWGKWTAFVFERHGIKIGPIAAETDLMKLSRLPIEKATADIEFSISKGAKSILDSGNDFQTRARGSKVKEVAF